jgi:hypothetical protein
MVSQDLSLLKNGHWPMAVMVQFADAPMFYVALLTFMIGSSVTMVLIVDAGLPLNRKSFLLSATNHHQV